MAPITDCNKGKIFVWIAEAEATFRKIKRLLITTPILVSPNFSLLFKLHSNASKLGIDIVLSQNERLVAYFNVKLFGAMLRYNIYDVKFYAVVQAICHWRYYLIHQEFILYTDHDVLWHLNSEDQVSTCHTEWIAFLRQFTFRIKYKLRALNKVADALSKRRNLLTVMRVEVVGFKSFKDLYETGPYCFGISETLQKCDKYTYFTLVDDFLFKGNQTCIHGCSLRDRIM